MTLASGTLLGPYEILAPLGVGGMGEVYRARDTRLGRDVAIKVLPVAFAEEPERLARFRREAQILALLNHPNIAAIYRLEESDGVVALAMELVPGEDLAHRLKRGPIPVEEALAIARQIAEALEEAHEKGVVHRDLKPANVKLTPDGKVKVLDFGLAKACEGESATSGPGGLTQSPTMSRHLTEAGMILGTAAYMSPEQARGRPVDKRTDIWAFGVVLFEMLTGRRMFAGETVSDTLAAVLKADPEWTLLPKATPGPIRLLLRRCLDRDVKGRLRDIGEARLTLMATESPDPAESSPAVTPPAQPRPVWRWPAGALGCLLAGAAIGGLSISRWRDSSGKAASRPARTIVLQAQGRGLDDSQAISPDGRWVAYTASGVLWIRNLGALEAREVKDSRGARGPFWSPRSDAVAFATAAALFKVSIEGEKPVELCRLGNGEFTGGSWSATRGIVFTLARANWNGDVLHVPEAGGEPEVFTRADPTKRERRLYRPHFLPDGRSLLYSVTTFDSNDGEIAVDRDGVRTSLGLGNGSNYPAYAPSGHLVFTRGSGGERPLWAVRFSIEALATTGAPFLVARSGTSASASADGTLVYGRYRPDPQQLVWVDRSGRLLGTIGEPVQYSIYTPSISPDGTRVAVSDDAAIGIWNVNRGIETRLTGAPERALSGDWLPGGREYGYAVAGTSGEFRARRADGSGEPRVLLQRGGANAPSFSSEGAFMAFHSVDVETGRDLWAVALSAPGEPFVILRTGANEALPRISPDGKLVAYESDASGRWEVQIQPFPRGEGRIQVSAGGGMHPMWNPKGGELFYVSGNDLMAVDVATAPTLGAGTPRRLFGGDAVGTRLTAPATIERRYDASSDGQRFVVVRGNGTGANDVVLADGALTSVPAGGR